LHEFENKRQNIYNNMLTVAFAISEVQMRKYLWPAILLTLLIAALAVAQAPPAAVADLSAPVSTVAPPLIVTAADTPDDAGHSITIRWERSSDDLRHAGKFDGYDILRGTSTNGPFTKIGDIPGGASGPDSLTKTYLDNDTKDGVSYYYAIDAKAFGVTSRAVSSQPASSKVQWFNMSQLNLFKIGRAHV
jgi:hypothetical protein